jgi:hypothetical protein
MLMVRTKNNPERLELGLSPDTATTLFYSQSEGTMRNVLACQRWKLWPVSKSYVGHTIEVLLT